MSLGEAFIEIHADLRPFARDLRSQVRPMIQAFEREINAGVGRQVLGSFNEEEGGRAGDRMGRGIKRSLTNQMKQKNIFLVIAASLASALDDGISALPTEIKAAIVAGILAASPLVAGALAGLVGAALGVAVAGVGILLGAQFEQVQERAVEFGRTVRRDLVESARAFAPAIISGFGMIEARVRRLRPLLDRIFDVGAGFLEPLLEGGLDALESVTETIFDNLDKIEPLVDELGADFAVLGQAIADSLAILLATGEDGQKAMRDLVALLGIAIISVASLIFALTKLYGALRTIIKVVVDLTNPFVTLFTFVQKFFDEIDKRTNKLKAFNNTNTDAAEIMNGVIVATKGETDALKEYRDAIENASKATKNQLDLSILWEESLDNLREALDKNGKTLDITTPKGRENARAFLDAIKIAEDAAVQRVRRGEQTGEDAANSYNAEIAKLREIARLNGISEQQFNDIFGQIVDIGAVRVSTTEMGLDNIPGVLGDANTEAAKLYNMLQLIKHLSSTIGAGGAAGVRSFADGGILHAPEIIRAGEVPEVIIPLTNPARAAQLLTQSGLDRMLGGSGPSQILVFIGNEQLDGRMVRIAERSNNAQALALNHGGRSL